LTIEATITAVAAGGYQPGINDRRKVMEGRFT
jgi:hypothetical protein